MTKNASAVAVKIAKICLCLGLCCMTLFLSVGYAMITDTLTITGTASYEPKAIYITNVTVTGGADISKYGYRHLFHGDYELANNQSITVTVTVKNNSGVVQYFDYLAPKKEDRTLKYDVTATDATGNTNAQGIRIDDGATQTFVFKIANKTGAAINFGSQTEANKLNELMFSLDEDSLTYLAAEGIAGAFTDFLNGKKESYTVDGETFTPKALLEKLTTQMNANASDSWSSGGFAANFDEAKSDDKKLIDAIFGDNTKLPINGQNQEVKLMIKEQEVTTDGTGKELVLYVTTNDLKTGGAFLRPNSVPVYAIVFGTDATGQWKQLGGILAGEAPVCNYTGLVNIYGGTGSFNTNYWESTEYSSADLSEAYAQAKAAT